MLRKSPLSDEFCSRRFTNVLSYFKTKTESNAKLTAKFILKTIFPVIIMMRWIQNETTNTEQSNTLTKFNVRRHKMELFHFHMNVF